MKSESQDKYLLSSPVQKYRKSYCTTPGSALALSASALTKVLKFYVKVFKTSYFLNPQADLVYIWYNYRCWSKIFLSPIHTHTYGVQVKVTDLEILC